MLVLYINSTNNPLIMIINRIYEHKNLLSLYLVSFLVCLRTCQHPCTLQGSYEGLEIYYDDPLTMTRLRQ